MAAMTKVAKCTYEPRSSTGRWATGSGSCPTHRWSSKSTLARRPPCSSRTCWWSSSSTEQSQPGRQMFQPPPTFSFLQINGFKIVRHLILRANHAGSHCQACLQYWMLWRASVRNLEKRVPGMQWTISRTCFLFIVAIVLSRSAWQTKVLEISCLRMSWRHARAENSKAKEVWNWGL